jgi:peptide-methionine (S)-S-oxide reductase
VGYAGGHEKDPDYKKICTGLTGHAEVCHVKFDPSTLTFRELLLWFMRSHDATLKQPEDPAETNVKDDIGPQYRSIILYHDDDQRKVV